MWRDSKRNGRPMCMSKIDDEIYSVGSCQASFARTPDQSYSFRYYGEFAYGDHLLVPYQTTVNGVLFGWFLFFSFLQKCVARCKTKRGTWCFRRFLFYDIGSAVKDPLSFSLPRKQKACVRQNGLGRLGRFKPAPTRYLEFPTICV